MTVRKYLQQQRDMFEAEMAVLGRYDSLRVFYLRGRIDQVDDALAIIKERSQKDRPSLEQAS